MTPFLRWSIAAAAFALLLPPASAQLPPAAEESDLTLKERLSDKASDQQRVDDCNVPPEHRDGKRPIECGPGAERKAVASAPKPPAAPDPRK